MRKFPLAVLLCALVLALSCLAGEAGWAHGLGTPVVREIRADDSGQGGYAWNVVWDRDGVAWVGRERLWRWDGARWKVVGPDNLHAVRALCFDPQGLLWVGGINEFGSLDPSTLEYRSGLELLPEQYRSFGEVWAMHHDGLSLWIGTEHQLFEVGPSGFRAWDFSADHRVIFHFLPSGVYAHEVGKGIWRIFEGSIILKCSDKRVAEKSVVFLDDLSPEILLAASSSGLFQIDISSGEVVLFNPLHNATIRALSSARRIDSNYIALGTLEEGIHIIHNNGCVLKSDPSLSRFLGKIILNIKSSPDGTLFILGTSGMWNIDFYNGLLQLNEVSGFISGKIRSVATYNGSIGFSSDLGFFRSSMEDENQVTIRRISINESFKSEAIKGCYYFDEYSSLFRECGGAVELVKDFGRAVRIFEAVGDSLLYVGFQDRVEGYRMGSGGGYELVGGVPTPHSLQVLESDGEQRVWGWSPRMPLFELGVGRGGGLEAARHPVVAGRDMAVVEHALAVTVGGPVVVFRDAVARLAAGGGWESAQLPAGRGMPEALDFRLRDVGLEGWLVYWDEQLATNLLVRVEWPEGGPPRWEVVPWLDMRELGRIHRLKVLDWTEDTLLIAGMKGLLLAPTDLSESIPAPRRPVIWDSGQGERPAADTVLEYGASGMRYSFSSPLSGGYYPVRYQTRLVGMENDWSEPSVLPMRELGREAFGDYRLEVRALDPFGRTSAVAAVGLRILTPWYRTTPAYLLWVVVVAALFYAFMRYREQRLRLRQAELERLVEVRTRQLREANKVKDEFVASISHEIRNPLNGVIGLIGQLKEGITPPVRCLAALRMAAHYLQLTVEGVLDIAKLESGQIQLQEALFDVGRLAEAVAGTFREEAAGKGLQLTYQIRVPEGTGIVADERKLQQIFGNLTANAVKFTPSGSVHLGLVLQPEGPNRGLLKFWVEDTGPGIPEADRERIFEKFYQVRVNGRKTPGTGLGLTTVKAYVERMGGRIELKSELGAGSVFTVAIPVAIAPYIHEEAQSGRKPVEDSAVRILVVEDTDYNRIMMEEMLTAQGLRVDTAVDGREGLQKALAGAYHAVLLDWEMPEMNGLEVARALRSSGRLPAGTRLIGLTAYATADVRAQCLAAGMDAFLTKPLDARQLWRVLDSLLPESAPPPPLPEPATPDVALVLGRGLLGEMPGDGWELAKARWESYLEDYLAELSAAMQGDDVVAMRKSAHKLLGHLRMLQVAGLPDILQNLLVAAHEGDAPAVRRRWEEFGRGLPRFREEFARL